MTLIEGTGQKEAQFSKKPNDEDQMSLYSNPSE
jgi:hypothetical protein